MQSKANKRTTGSEQYYTTQDVADFCTKKFLEIVGKFGIFIEPCGGEGSFIKSLQKEGVKNILSFDIDPRYEGVIKQDYLTSVCPENCFVITNPPFGRANSLSKKFFNKAAKDKSSFIGFLVPRSWKKWSIQNSLDFNYHLVAEFDLPKNCFYGPNVRDEGVLNTIFQIWQRKDFKRKKIEVEDKGYISKIIPKNGFVEGANVSIIVFGHSCGKVEKIIDKKIKSKTTTMYLFVEKEEVINALKSLDYSRFYKNVAYVEALSIKEINYLLNEYFERV